VVIIHLKCGLCLNEGQSDGTGLIHCICLVSQRTVLAYWSSDLLQGVMPCSLLYKVLLDVGFCLLDYMVSCCRRPKFELFVHRVRSLMAVCSRWDYINSFFYTRRFFYINFAVCWRILQLHNTQAWARSTIDM
jgi:hypothetical protein